MSRTPPLPTSRSPYPTRKSTPLPKTLPTLFFRPHQPTDPASPFLYPSAPVPQLPSVSGKDHSARKSHALVRGALVLWKWYAGGVAVAMAVVMSRLGVAVV